MPTICTESALEDLPDAICNIFHKFIDLLSQKMAGPVQWGLSAYVFTCEATSVTDPEEDVLVLVVATPPPESMYCVQELYTWLQFTPLVMSENN